MLTRIKKSIPNAITCLNLFSGCLAIVFIFNSKFELACYCVLAAAVFDFFDGLAARALKAYSELGVQLDSLADLVSFGVAPAAMLHRVFLLSTNISSTMDMLSFIPFLIAIFSALRLAKFNIDTRQHESFLGLPTPACGIFIVSTIAAAGTQFGFVGTIIYHPAVIIAISLILSALLVCEIKMFSLKFKPQATKSIFIKKYLIHIIFLLVSILSVILFGIAGVSLTILLYIIISVVQAIISKFK